MLKGLKHAVGCKCGDMIIHCEDLDEVDRIEASARISDCCKSKFTYIGLQPFYESVINVPIIKANPNLSMETIIESVPEPKVIIEPVISAPIPERAKEESIPEVKKAPETTNVGNVIPESIKGLIEAGPKGFVTNTQMIPVLKDLIDANDIKKIELLKNTFPSIFEKSIKYLPKKYQDKIK
jgi:hypothetical protein